MNFQLLGDEISAFFRNPQFVGKKFFSMICVCAESLSLMEEHAPPSVGSFKEWGHPYIGTSFALFSGLLAYLF